jgi:molybdate transport system permease protein
MQAPEVLGIAALTVRVALAASFLNLVPGVALAYLLARRRFPGRSLIEAIVALPLVLPPVAVGLVLLLTFSRRAVIGGVLESAGVPILFTWRGAAIASAVMSFPLLVRSTQQAFDEVPVRLEQIARSLGAGRWATFWRITLPLARRGLAYGLLLAFLRAMGEFGATNLVAGNIPGRTRTLSMGIYSAVQASRDADALILAGVSAAVSLLAVVIGERYLRSRRAAS